MNERIRELAEQCRTLYRGDNGQYVEQFDEQKFAELIVNECADICYNRDYTDGSTYGEAIQKNFGIK